MGKRSSLPRVDKDFYPTPAEAVLPLLPHLPTGHRRFVEPCAGDGRLVRHLEKHGYICVDAFDIEPRHESVDRDDALKVLVDDGDMVITNFPWTRSLLHPLIEHWRVQMPTWTLLDANWMFTKQAGPFLRYASHIVTVGRVKWIEGSKMTGKDDAAWFRFQAAPCETRFFGR
jgi:hypothetical protein